MNEELLQALNEWEEAGGTITGGSKKPLYDEWKAQKEIKEESGEQSGNQSQKP